jgi:hypothetical protein
VEVAEHLLVHGLGVLHVTPTGVLGSLQAELLHGVPLCYDFRCCVNRGWRRLKCGLNLRQLGVSVQVGTCRSRYRRRCRSLTPA